MLAALAIVFLVWLVFGYFAYGRWIAKQFKLDDERETPANTVNDGEDFVPTKPFYLFGQHFSAIAAAGPIAGPIIACQAFGWLPCLLWIAFGVVLIGAVHDFASLASSVRHGATSIAEITREKLGNGAGRAMMAFIWIALIYVIIAFTDITAGTFVAGDEALQNATGFNRGRRGCVCFDRVSFAFDCSRSGRKIYQTSALAFDYNFCPGGFCARIFGNKIFDSVSALAYELGGFDFNLLHYRIACSGLGVASAARLSRRFRALHGARARRDRDFFRRLRHRTADF